MFDMDLDTSLVLTSNHLYTSFLEIWNKDVEKLKKHFEEDSTDD